MSFTMSFNNIAIFLIILNNITFFYLRYHVLDLDLELIVLLVLNYIYLLLLMFWCDIVQRHLICIICRNWRLSK